MKTENATTLHSLKAFKKLKNTVNSAMLSPMYRGGNYDYQIGVLEGIFRVFREKYPMYSSKAKEFINTKKPIF